MKINEVKKKIYNFFKAEINAKYPEIFVLDTNNACNNVFWDRVKQTRPQMPFIMLTDGEPQKIYRRYEWYYENYKYKVRKEMRLPVTFGVYTVATSGNLVAADNQATEIIEYIQDLFTEKESTFIALHNQGITINELESSNIRDLSAYQQTNQEFRKEVDIAFEYVDIETEQAEPGKALNVHIQVDNTTDFIDGDYEATNT